MSGFIGVNNQFAQEFRQPVAKLQGIITSIYDIGYAAGALLNFFFGEQFGCKNIIIAGGTTMIVGTILGSFITLAQLFGRIVTSIRNGVNSLTIPMYQYGVCSPSNRGMLLNLQGTVTIIGLSFPKAPIQGRLPSSSKHSPPSVSSSNPPERHHVT